MCGAARLPASKRESCRISIESASIYVSRYSDSHSIHESAPPFLWSLASPISSRVPERLRVHIREQQDRHVPDQPRHGRL